MAEDSGGETSLALRGEPRSQLLILSLSVSVRRTGCAGAVLQELRAGYRLASALRNCLRRDSHQKPAEAQVGPIISRTE